MRVGDIACGRAGDKGATLDLSIVARDRAAYELLAAELTEAAVAAGLQAPAVQRYELAELMALKFVVPGVLGGGTYTSMRAGMHWQKAAISAVLDFELAGRPAGLPVVCVRPPGWISGGRGSTSPNAFTAMRAWVLRAEQLGFDGLLLGDRMLSAAVGSEHSSGSVYGASMLEATTTLAGLAAVTERMLSGPLVMVLPYRHPIQLAKTVATLDVICSGRLVLGAGLGWNEAEFTALEIDRSQRARRFEESLDICRALWAGETVTTRAPGPLRTSAWPRCRSEPAVRRCGWRPSRRAARWTGPTTCRRSRGARCNGSDGWPTATYRWCTRPRLGAGSNQSCSAAPGSTC